MSGQPWHSLNEPFCTVRYGKGAWVGTVDISVYTPWGTLGRVYRHCYGRTLSDLPLTASQRTRIQATWRKLTCTCGAPTWRHIGNDGRRIDCDTLTAALADEGGEHAR